MHFAVIQFTDRYEMIETRSNIVYLKPSDKFNKLIMLFYPF